MPIAINPNDVRIFSGSSHPKLAASIASHLGIPLENTLFNRFSNDNLYIQLGASVRSRIVYIVQSLIPPVSDHLLQLFMMLDIAHSAGAREVHAIIPYFSYARSDKKNAPRISITARLVADLLQTAGATHVMTMTLHSPQVHGFFSIPTDPITARGLFLNYLRERTQVTGITFNANDTIVVAPDYGRAGSATRFASLLSLPAISAEKNRISDTEVHIGELVLKQVEGFQRAIVYDDEIATGGSVIHLSNLLAQGGIKEIILICTHGLFLNGALQRILKIPQVTEIITTDTVPIPAEYLSPQLKVLSVGPVIGEAIYRNYTRQSIGNLFDFGDSEADHVT
ncbi:MAG: ribose-phosphate pyrophosphokinase [Anaerolineales bacterium]|nr:ribose-phosphate pyrophosphokinase [Anaerolineales bacterium]